MEPRPLQDRLPPSERLDASDRAVVWFQGEAPDCQPQGGFAAAGLAAASLAALLLLTPLGEAVGQDFAQASWLLLPAAGLCFLGEGLASRGADEPEKTASGFLLAILVLGGLFLLLGDDSQAARTGLSLTRWAASLQGASSAEALDDWARRGDPMDAIQALGEAGRVFEGRTVQSFSLSLIGFLGFLGSSALFLLGGAALGRRISIASESGSPWPGGSGAPAPARPPPRAASSS